MLILGSALLTVYGFSSWAAGTNWGLCGSDMFNLWKPLIPAGVEGTWAPVLVKKPPGRSSRSLVFQQQLSPGWAW